VFYLAVEHGVITEKEYKKYSGRDAGRNKYGEIIRKKEDAKPCVRTSFCGGNSRIHTA